MCYFQECASTLFVEQLQNGMMDVISQGLVTVHVVKSPITECSQLAKVNCVNRSATAVIAGSKSRRRIEGAVGSGHKLRRCQSVLLSV